MLALPRHVRSTMDDDTKPNLQFRTPHIRIKNPEACLKCARKQCTIVCPAGVYHWDAEQLKINVNWPACLESGGCLVACHEFKKDRKSTRLNSSHLVISYAVFCLKKKT